MNYFLLAPFIKRKCNKTKKKFFASLDPGVRKFQTLYSEDESIRLGERASSCIQNLLFNLDRAISNKNKRLASKLRIKIKNLQNELHHKVSRFLCNNYHNIVVTKLTKENDIIKRNRRTLRTKTVRKMVVLAHCKFVELLKTKADEYEDVNVYETTEEYTSQICPNCNQKTKTTQENYICNNCSCEVDRDLLGSRNILLKFWNLLYW